MNEKKWEVECVIYDCDGVLFDSLDANGRLYNHLAKSMGRAPLTPDEHRYCHTHTVFESIRYMFPNNEEMEKKTSEFLKQNVNFQDFIQYLKMEANIINVLEILKRRGLKRAISTNRTTSMKHIMERFNLWPHFDMVVTALDVTRPKPAPESVEKILTNLAVHKEKAIFIGDSEVDRETASSSGIKFVAYKNNELKADVFIEDHLALLDYLSDGNYPQA